MLAALSMLLAACQAASPNDLTETRVEALQPKVSAPFYLEGYPTVPVSSGSVLFSAMACGAVRCMVFYEDEFLDQNLASRVAADGTPTDIPRLKLPTIPVTSFSHAHPFEATARGDVFLLTYLNHKGGALIDGASGQVLEEFDEKFLGSGARTVAGEHGWAAFSGIGGSKVSIQIFDENLVQVGANVIGPTTSSVVSVAPAGDQFLVVWPGFAQRVNAITGDVLDATPIEYSRYSLGKTRVAFVDGVYIIAWIDDGNIYTSRVRAVDGVPLDPDDYVNEVSGAHKVCDACAPVDLSLNVFDGRVLLSWTNDPPQSYVWQLNAAWLDPVTALREDGNATGNQFVLGMLKGQNFELEAHGDVALVYSESMLVGFSVGPEEVIATGSANAPANSRTRWAPAAASNGTDFLAAWIVNGDVLATRVDPVSGAYVDDPPLPVGAGIGVAVASLGSDYLVVWLKPDKTIGRRLLSADGQLGPTLPDLNVDAFDISDVKVTPDGARYLLTWYQDGRDVRGIRVAADGSLLDSWPTLFRYTTPENYPNESSPHYEVAADFSSPANQRKFLVGVQRPVAEGTRVRVLQSQTGVLANTVALDTTIKDAHLVSNGTSFLMTFPDAGDGSEHFVYLDPTTGAAAGQSVPYLPSAGISVQEAWFDGRSYNLLVKGDEPNAYYVRRYSPALDDLDTALPGNGTLLVPDLTFHYEEFAVASNAKGRSLFVSQELDVERLGVTLRGRFFDNDGEKSSPPGTAGSSSEGGSAGANNGAAGGGLGGADGGTASTGGVSSHTGGGEASGGTAGSSGGNHDSTPTDGGTNDGSVHEDSHANSGCGCSVPGSAHPGGTLVLSALAASCLALRRRRFVGSES